MSSLPIVAQRGGTACVGRRYRPRLAPHGAVAVHDAEPAMRRRGDQLQR